MARTPGSARPDAGSRDRILDAFLALLGERPFDEISLGDVAARAGVSLGELRAGFGSTFDMIAGFVRRTDEAVLAGGADGVTGDDMADQPARDRLFDVLMRRLDVLGPHRAAVRSLARSARRDPLLALGLNKLAVRSQQWMMAAAGIDTAGFRGRLRAQGLAVLFARVLNAWLTDEDPGLARTMAVLDRELAKGEQALGLLDRVCRLATCSGRRPRRAEQPEPEAPIAA